MGSQPSRYIPALDGLRALAVAAVVAYHMNATLLPSGLLGVTMFFVLSGYLITGILIREWSSSKTINLPRFWLRRVRRLFPAILFMVMCVAVLTAALAPDMFTKLRNDLVAALLWFTNWWYILQDLSYFEAMGAPSPVTHFWSLAIEEQFYLVWPPLLLLLFKMRVKKKHLERGILVACVISVVLMMVLFDPLGDPSRVYYGTDTRAFSLLIGAWLAFEFPASRVRGKGRAGLGDSQRTLVHVAGAVALAGIVVMMVVVNGYSSFLYYGGILLFSLLTAVLIVSLVDPRSVLARFFSLPPLVWVGKLSYSIYLWHYPLLLLMNPRNFTGETPWYAYVGQVVLIVAVAAFSYYVVESPIRHGAIGRLVQQVREEGARAISGSILRIVYLASAGVLAVATIACIAVVPSVATQANTNLSSTVVRPVSDGDPNAEAGAGDASGDENPGGTAGVGNAASADFVGPVMVAVYEPEGETPLEKAANTDFLLIGDSVSVALSDYGGYGYFGESFPHATLDAAINRRLYEGVGIYQQHVASGWNGSVVIFELSTNGAISAEEIDELVGVVPPDKHIFLVNVRSPQPLQDLNNPLLYQAAQTYDNVDIIDWYATSAGHDEYFDGDGIHLTGQAGCQAYVAMITNALATLYE